SLCRRGRGERTLGLRRRGRQRAETRGCTRDLPRYLAKALPAVAAGRTKLITNAGGINPTSAARAAMETAKELGVSGIRVATVLGDDLKPRLAELRDAGTAFTNAESGASF